MQYPHVKEGFVHAIDAQKDQVAMFSDPNMTMDMMKKNLSMIVP
jgi:ER membrane protein complex subunit 3